MRKNLGMFFGLSRCGAGAVLLALCAFATVSRADVVVNNTGGNSSYSGGVALGEVFTMSGTSGDLASLVLQLFSSAGGVAEVDLFSISSGAPSSELYDLGNVTVGAGNNQLVSVTSLPNNVLLNANTTYAIVLEAPSSGSLAWDGISGTASGGTGPALGGEYYESGAVWFSSNPNASFQMNLQTTTPVPEVPMTGVVMGFGALAIALGRKLRLAVSNIA
jgi:hypothetical protein